MKTVTMGKKASLLTLIGLFVFTHSFSQTTAMASDIDTLSLQDLLNIKVTVASFKELTPLESPGIVSVVTAEDIRLSGARDLMEVLDEIPGFQMGVDVQGNVGLSVRGNWAHEGKVLLLIDGQEMNDGLYSTIQLGNHYPVENIERIEIIRGPGSAMYGGNAEYAVINIISGEPQKKDFKCFARYGISDGTATDQSAGIAFGVSKNETTFSIQGNVGQTQRSLATYTDAFSNSYSMKDNSDISNAFFNLGVSHKGLKFRLISDYYRVESRDQYQHSTSEIIPVDFRTTSAEIKYDFKVNEKWTLTPKISGRFSNPWRTRLDSAFSDVFPLNTNNLRLTYSLLSNNTFSEKVSLSSGFSYFTDNSETLLENSFFNTTNSTTFAYSNYSLYSQGIFNTKIANITAGFRFNGNSRFTSSIVPRIGLTRAFGDLNVKALYSRAFRTPGTMNIDAGVDVKPENTDAVELELGYRLSDDAYFSLNSYYLLTDDPIVFYYNNVVNYDAYMNYSSTGTMGLEAQYTLKKKWGKLDLGGSYYIANDGKDLSSYRSPESETEHLGISPLKLQGRVNYYLTKKLSLYLAYIGYSERKAIVSYNENSSITVYETLPFSHTINVHLDYSNILARGFSVSFGVNNILNEETHYVQPYSSNHAPLPGLGREIIIKVAYSLY
ncbi:MAG: TonB-dependent receptor [Bacteroidetes bacterium]|nr:TonB-dependent receptor [Bacteroidota bacterium]